MQLTLVNKVLEAKDTYSYFFKSNGKVDFMPGQYIYLTLTKLKYPDERGNTRHFTIANSPTEKDYIQVTTRIRSGSGYKKTLNELQIGNTAEGKGPNGSFVLNSTPTSTNQIFLAGGIGITPFRSMIKYNIDNNLKIPMRLIYSNSDSEFVFKKELDTWRDENEYITVDYIDTSKDGRLNKDKLTNFASGKLTTSVFWIVGPPGFVSAMEEILEELNIQQDNIKTEKFTGY